MLSRTVTQALNDNEWNKEFEKQIENSKCGFRILNYDDMLFPQYKDEFDKTISKDTWELLQKEARENLKDLRFASYEVAEHWKSIVRGNVPFGYKVKEI